MMNIFTKLLYTIEEAELSKDALMECKGHLRILTMLISNEDILYGETDKLFEQRLSLNDLVVLCNSIVCEETKSHINIKKAIGGEIKTDRYYAEQMIINLLRWLQKQDGEIEMSISKKNVTIDNKKGIKLPSKNPSIDDLIKSKELSEVSLTLMIFFQIAKLLGVKTNISKTKIVLQFK